MKLASLEDMKRHKRNLDARLDNFEEKLSALIDDCALMNTNVNANRERIEDLELKQDDAKQDDFIDVADMRMKVKLLDEEDANSQDYNLDQT